MPDKISKSCKIKCIVGISVCAVLMVLSFCGRYFSSPMRSVAGFFLGSFGIAFYGIMIAIITACSLILAGKRIAIPTKYIVNFALLFVAVTLFVHTLSATFYIKDSNSGEYVSYAKYVGYLFNYYDYISFGGVVFGSIVYALQRVLTIVGAIILEVGFLAWTVFVAGDFFYCYFTGKITLTAKSSNTTITPEPVSTNDVVSDDVNDTDRKRIDAYNILFNEQPATAVVEDVTPNEPINLFDPVAQSTFDTPSTPVNTTPMTVEDLVYGGTQTQTTNDFFAPRADQVQEPVVAPVPKSSQVVEDDWKITTSPIVQEPIDDTPIIRTTTIVEQPKVEEPIVSKPTPQVVEPVQQEPIVVQPTVQTEPIVTPVEQFDDDDDNVDVVNVVVDEPEFQSQVEEDDFCLDDDDDFDSQPTVDPAPVEPNKPDLVVVPTTTQLDDKHEQVRYDFVKQEDVKKAEESVHQYMEYVTPPSDLLNEPKVVEDTGAEDRELAARRIVAKLEVFGIKVELANIIVGPSVTRYMFKVLSLKTRMGDFAQYSDDLKACLEAPEDIRIEAPVQGTNLVGIEVANKVKTPVGLRSLLESDAFQNAKGKLVFAIGKDLVGNVITGDLASMPHLLVAGTTGSGKSVALNCLIVSLMYKYGPEYLRFLMVDPKYVELSRYNGIPHMLTRETIINMNDALAGMDYLIKEMEARYQLFKDTGVDNIVTYNRQVNPKLTQRLPYLIYIVDELADLMTVNKKGFEEKLGRLTAKARASGIHIVLATQRPGVDVITGTIKNNLSCRMALKVPAPQDSKTIINGAGADKLLGNGDMLYMGPGASSLARIQGAYVSNDEIKNLVEFLRDSNELYYDDKVSNEIFVSKQTVSTPVEEDDNSADEKRQKTDMEYRILGKKALRYWIEHRNSKASISSLQRGMSIGFNKAGKVYEMLQGLGYIEKPADSEITKAVKVLVTLDQLDGLFPDVVDED